MADFNFNDVRNAHNTRISELQKPIVSDSRQEPQFLRHPENPANKQEGFLEWKAKIETISQSLSSKPEMLKQYSIWLKSSEAGTKYRGKNILDMLQGAMNYLFGIDFIPGIEHKNLAAVLQNLQEKTGLDLGLCEYLKGDIQEVEKQTQESKQAYCKCNLSGALVEDLSCCMPPQRCYCPSRQRKKSESSS